MLITKNLWLSILLSIILISSIGYALPFLSFKQKGVQVILVNNSKCTLKEGDIITEIRGKIIENSEDFYSTIANYKKGEYVSMVVNNKPGGCTLKEDGNIGVKVVDLANKKRIKFGFEIEGGKAIYLSFQNLTKNYEILKERIEYFNLPIEIKIQNNSLEMVYPNYVDIQKILFKGKFEGRILESIDIENGKGEIRLSNKTFVFETKNNSILINSKEVKINQSFYLDGIEFKLLNITENSVWVEAKVFGSKNIEKIYDQLARLRYDSRFGVYEFSIPIKLNENGREKFYKVVRGIGVQVIGENLILKGRLVYYLDTKSIGLTSLPYEIVSRNLTILNVFSFGENQKEIEDTKEKIIVSLKFGELDNFNVIKQTDIQAKYPNLKFYFPISIIAISIVFSIVLFLIKRNLIFSLIPLSTPYILFGLILLSQLTLEYGWILDIQTFVGILIASIISFIEPILIIKRSKERKLKFSEYHLTEIIILLVSIPLAFIFKGVGLSLFISSFLIFLEKKSIKI